MPTALMKAKNKKTCLNLLIISYAADNTIFVPNVVLLAVQNALVVYQSLHNWFLLSSI